MKKKRHLRVADELLEVLEYLHGRSPRLVHRDIKPANIVLRPQGVVLVDFDTARDLGRDVTHRATMVGTAGYMAPEQYGGTVGPASDLYSVGATLIHLLTGQSPPIPQPERPLEFEHNANVSPATLGFLRRLTAWRPTDRLSSATEARKELVELRRPKHGPQAPRARPASPAPDAISHRLQGTSRGVPRSGPQPAPSAKHVENRPLMSGYVNINGQQVSVSTLGHGFGRPSLGGSASKDGGPPFDAADARVTSHASTLGPAIVAIVLVSLAMLLWVKCATTGL